MKKNPHAVALGRKGGKAKGKPKGFAAMTSEAAAKVRDRKKDPARIDAMIEYGLCCHCPPPWKTLDTPVEFTVFSIELPVHLVKHSDPRIAIDLGIAMVRDLVSLGVSVALSPDSLELEKAVVAKLRACPEVVKAVGGKRRIRVAR